MIPILYSADELTVPVAAAFTSNGIGRLADALSCVVTEERNGIYELELTYPITGKWFSQMQIGCFIGAIHDDQHDVQPFQIYKISAPLNGVVTFYAHHLSYLLSGIILQPFSATSITDLFNQIQSQSVNNNPFTFWTEKLVGTPYVLEIPSAVRQILAGQQGSILDVYGKGEYLFDKYDVKLYTNRGVSTGATIRYGKNLTSLKKDLDNSKTYGAVAPYWKGDGGIVYLSENVLVVSQPGLPATPLDLSGDFESMPTEQQLADRALEYLTNNEPWIPDENISIDFLQLWQTSEYDDVAALQRVSLCDKVDVIYSALGVVARNQEIIKVVYDTLGEFYTKMELGKLQTNLYEAIASAAVQEVGDVVTPGALEAAIAHNNSVISGGLGGYVVYNLNADGQPQEILVMDTPDVDTAVNVLRINKNGIAFSTSGINGDWKSAWTIDGQFNAEFIRTGVLNANLLRAGVIAAASDPSKFSLDLETGELTMDVSLLKLSGDTVDVIIANQTEDLADDLSDLRSHIVIDTDEGSMQFIAERDNPITLKIEKDPNDPDNGYHLAIYNGGTAIDRFGSGGTVTENLTISDTGSFTQGGFRWIVRSSGRMDLVYVGD